MPRSCLGFDFMNVKKIKKLINNPLIFIRDYLLKVRPLSLNELEIDLLTQDEILRIQKNFIYLSNDLVKKNDEPVDVVFTWVDDADSRWRESFYFHKKLLNPNYTSSSAERYSNSNEIFYSVKAVIKLIPWVNKIYIVSDNQIHNDLVGEDKVVFVKHEEIIPKKYLPTFNSHVIEAHLYKIDNLSENFIYFNDDVFVAQALEKEHFFSKNGIASAFFNKKKISSSKLLTPTTKASLNSKALIEKKFNCTIDRYFVHTYFPLKKSVYEYVWENFEKEIELFLMEKFRSDKDLNLASFLVPWVSYLLGKSSASLDICYYFNHRSAASKMYWSHLLQKSNLPHSFCANDFQGGNSVSLSEDLGSKLNEFYKK